LAPWRLCAILISFFIDQTGRFSGRRLGCLPCVLSRRSSKSEVGSLKGEAGTPET
jgi:hypothetical protein